MQIFIRTDSDGDGENCKIPEWSIIEMQGDLHTNNKDTFHGKVIGDLHFTKEGEPMLIIGHHVLTGKESKFEKPLAILEKKSGGGTDDTETEYIVKGLVKRKLIFSDRPRPIVANTSRDPDADANK